MQQRRKEIDRLAKARRENLQANEDLQLNREQLIANVSQIIVDHI